MGRREALLEQQPHRVALVAEGGLDADQHLAEALAQHMDGGAIRLLAAGCRAPLRLDLAQVGLPPHMVVGGNAVHDIGIRAEALGIAVEDACPQFLDRGRDLDVIAIRLHGGQRVEQRLEDREEGGGAHGTGIGREVEQDDRHLARVLRRLAQRHLLGDT